MQHDHKDDAKEPEVRQDVKGREPVIIRWVITIGLLVGAWFETGTFTVLCLSLGFMYTELMSAHMTKKDR